MANALRFRHLPESHEEIAGERINVYQLEVRDILLGFLYLNHGLYTIAWRGRLDFRKVEKEAFEFLDRQMLGGRWSLFGFSRKPPHRVVRASFIVSNGTDELVEYKLSDPVQRREYEEILVQPYNISFARYDFFLRVDQFRFQCSFTAENSENSSDQDSEIAIQSPRSLPPSVSTLTWIVEQHKMAEYLKNQIDLETSTEALTKLISINSNDSATQASFV